MKPVLLTIIFLAFALSSCTENTPLSLESSRQVVVQGYLVAGEPVKNIQLSSTFSLFSQDSIAPPINDAKVSLVRNGVKYELVNTNDAGYYHYPAEDLDVNIGDVFHLEILAFGKVITAKTIVPEIPDGIAQDETLLLITSDDAVNSEININWRSQSAGKWFHLVIIENLDQNPGEITHDASNPPSLTQQGVFIDAADALNTLPFNNGKSIARQPIVERPDMFISYPISRTTFNVTSQELTHTGKHYSRIFRVNQEYADLYISQQQDVHNLNEALSNIHNGLGIFTAFSASDSLFFRVRQK